MVVAFSSLARIWGECSTIHYPLAVLLLLLFVCFLFFKVEISSGTLIPLFGQNLSNVAQRAETTVAECSLTSCV